MIILVICYSRINLLNRLSDETLGRYFNFEKNGYDAVMAVYFKPGIGEWLWENGISLEQYLENLVEMEVLTDAIEVFDTNIRSISFDPLDTPWLAAVRGFARSINALKNSLQ